MKKRREEKRKKRKGGKRREREEEKEDTGKETRRGKGRKGNIEDMYENRVGGRGDYVITLLNVNRV